MMAKTHAGATAIRDFPQTAGPARFDSETAALLRAILRPVFDGAADWAALMAGLRDKGYRLCMREGRLSVVDAISGVRICGLRFLGYHMTDLVRRMGRPVVIARSGHDGDIVAPGHH